MSFAKPQVACSRARTFAHAPRAPSSAVPRLRGVRVTGGRARCASASEDDRGSPFDNTQQFLDQKTRQLRERAAESAERISHKAQAAAREADSKWQIRTRLRHVREDAARLYPHYKSRFNKFARTKTGLATIWAAFILSIVTGVFFQVVHFAFLALWLLPVLLILSRAFMRNSQRDPQEPSQQFRDTWASYFGRGRGTGDSGGRSSRGRDSGGPVIDTTFESVDDSPGRKGKKPFWGPA